MADRVTSKQVARVFELFCKTFNLPIARRYDDVGGYALDRYMGYQIVQMAERGGVHTPFGSHRYTAREFVNVMRFAMEVSDRLGLGRHNPPRRRHQQRHQYAGFDR